MKGAGSLARTDAARRPGPPIAAPERYGDGTRAATGGRRTERWWHRTGTQDKRRGCPTLVEPVVAGGPTRPVADVGDPLAAGAVVSRQRIGRPVLVAGGPHEQQEPVRVPIDVELSSHFNQMPRDEALEVLVRRRGRGMSVVCRSVRPTTRKERGPIARASADLHDPPAARRSRWQRARVRSGSRRRSTSPADPALPRRHSAGNPQPLPHRGEDCRGPAGALPPPASTWRCPACPSTSRA